MAHVTPKFAANFKNERKNHGNKKEIIKENGSVISR